MACCTGRPTAVRVHASLEVDHPLLGQVDSRLWDCAGVLFDRVHKHDQIPRTLVEDPVAGACEPDPQLPEPALDLRGDRKIRRWVARPLVIQVLLDEIVDLRRPLRRQAVDEPVDGLDAPLVAVVDGLRSRHSPSIP